MLNYKITHKYRDCTVISEPIEEYFKVTIHDNFSCEQILEEYYPKICDLTTKQVLTECELYIDSYIEKIESLGNVK